MLKVYVEETFFVVAVFIDISFVPSDEPHEEEVVTGEGGTTVGVGVGVSAARKFGNGATIWVL